MLWAHSAISIECGIRRDDFDQLRCALLRTPATLKITPTWTAGSVALEVVTREAEADRIRNSAWVVLEAMDQWTGFDAEKQIG